MKLTRLFTDPARARSASDRLLATGYEAKEIRIVTSAQDHSEAALRHAGLSHVNAAHYAQRIAAGGALVIVEAPFGTASHATHILDNAGAVEEAQTRSETMAWDDATPLSSALGWPVLLHDATPLSRLFGMPTLSENQRGKAALSHQAAPLSHTLGLKLLSGSASPFSRLLGLKTLSANPAPLSSAIGMKTLTQKPEPMTVSRLLHDPAPLSNLLGLPLLIHSDKRERHVRH